MKFQRVFSILFLILGFTFYVSSGLASHTPTHGPMGEMKDDVAAKKSFEEGKMLQDHVYYYLGGSIVQPDSIIALKKGYKLRDSKVWSKVDDMSPSIIRGWLQAWKNDGHAFSDMNGGVLLAPDGKEAGIWYSHYPGSAVMMPSPGVMDVYQPHPRVGNRPGQGS